MTSERDFDRLARAWLELGPNEAPDRVVTAVLQAAETTPQVRRPMRWPLWRLVPMTRLPVAAGAVAILVVAVRIWRISGAVAPASPRDFSTPPSLKLTGESPFAPTGLPIVSRGYPNAFA